MVHRRFGASLLKRICSPKSDLYPLDHVHVCIKLPLFHGGIGVLIGASYGWRFKELEDSHLGTVRSWERPIRAPGHGQSFHGEFGYPTIPGAAQMEISECEAVGFAGIERFHAGADPLGLGHPAESAGMVSLERFHLCWFNSDGSTWSPKGAAPFHPAESIRTVPRSSST